MKDETQNVRSVLRQIFKLQERMKRDAIDIKRLERLLSVEQKGKFLQSASAERSQGPDLRDAIMAVFLESKTSVMKIDDVLHGITSKYNFTPDKLTLTNRLNYLTDRQHKLERGEKRGRYRLPTRTIGAQQSTDG